MTAKRISWLDRALNAIRVVIVNPFTREDLHPSYDEGTNADRTLLVNKPRQIIELLADDAGSLPSPQTYDFSMKGKKNLVLCGTLNGDELDMGLVLLKDIEPTNDDPALGDYVDITEDCFSTSRFWDGTNNFVAGRSIDNFNFSVADNRGFANNANILRISINVTNFVASSWVVYASYDME